ncbi:MAG: RlmE family RNA methyltransferase [Desulforegulaceae bacterium]|nr:RlmE family RNA methyltransferase [Desulforegulaceae bacterium]
MAKKKKKTNKWDDDFYTQLAKKENYPARSVYKLKEINEKFKFFKKGQNILDLGCAPGSWLKFAAEKTGKSGSVLGVDLKEIEILLPENVKFFQGDIFEKETIDFLSSFGPYNVLMSDMAPDTTGVKFADSVKSAALCESALYLCQSLLEQGGVFITKIFQGPDFDNFARQVLQEFDKRKIFKPKACRKNSKEVYIVGMGRK